MPLPQHERMTGYVQHRTEQLGQYERPVLDKPPHQQSPCAAVAAQTLCRFIHVAVEHTGLAAIDRMSKRDLGKGPLQTMLGKAGQLERGRRDTKRVNGCAHVVHETWQRQLCRTGSATNRVGRFEHENRVPCFGESHGGRQPIGP